METKIKNIHDDKLLSKLNMKIFANRAYKSPSHVLTSIKWGGNAFASCIFEKSDLEDT